MTKGVMRERHAPLTEEELDAVTVVFHQFETGLREGTIYTKVSIRHYMEEELDAVTVVFHQFETGLREGTIYTKVRLHGKAHLKIRRQNSHLLRHRIGAVCLY